MMGDTTRVVIVTVREHGGEWEIEVDAQGIDPWSVSGILRGAYRHTLDELEGPDDE